MATLAELLSSRIPPHSLEAERAVLGALLLERESLPRAIEVLRASDFYKEGHRQIFSSMVALFERNEPVDLLTLAEELRRRNTLEEVGGAAALASLVEEAATAAHVVSYANIVREKALLRDLIRSATEIIGQSYEQRDDVDALLDQAEEISKTGKKEELVRAQALIRQAEELWPTLPGLEKRREEVCDAARVPPLRRGEPTSRQDGEPRLGDGSLCGECDAHY